MKITWSTDEDAGTSTVTIEFPTGSDPDRVADIAWSSVSQLLERQQRERGTVPERMLRAG